MINTNEVAERRYQKMCAAGMRWKEHLPSLVQTSTKLIRDGSLATASVKQRNRYLTRQLQKVMRRPAGLGEERRIGPAFEFDATPPTIEALNAGNPVARIVEMLDGGRIGEGFATGFLVHGPLLITNWHIFANPGDAVGVGAQFGFQKNEDGLINSGAVFELNPTQFFLSNETLDIAIVGISARAAIGESGFNLSTMGKVRLIPTVGKILVGQPISIIQHPDGMHKQWAVRENKLLREPSDDEIFLEYSTDTMPGSSGSPAFNTDWELVAVHHSGVPRMNGPNVLLRNGEHWRPGDPDSEVDWVANEGARVSKIIAHLKTLNIRDEKQSALLASFIGNSTDTVMKGIGTMPTDSKFERAHDSLSNKQGDQSPPTIVVHGTAHIHIYGSGEPNLGISGPPHEVSNADAMPFVLEKKIRFDSNYKSRPGYDAKFLDGFRVPEPQAPIDDVIKHGRGQKILRYHHYSLAMHKSRRFAIWAASNIDYDETKRWRKRKEFGTDTWKTDPRIRGELQIEGQELYDPAKKFDKGHLVRRDDVAWGNTKKEEEFGNSDSFHYTNCTPQHEEFNRAIFQFDGVWGALETHIARQSKFLGHRVIVFAGPILSDDDPFKDFGVGSKIQIPIGFWKVVIAIEDKNDTKRLRSYGFVLSQQDAIDEFGWENRFKAGKFVEQQKPLSEISAKTGIKFPDIVTESDGFKIDVNEGHQALRDFEDIRL